MENENVETVVETDETNKNTEENIENTETSESTMEETVETENENVEEQKQENTESEESNKTDEPETNLSEKITGLEAEIERLKEELKTNTNTNTELIQTKGELVTGKTLITDYEAILNGIVDSKLQNVPENIKSLMPTNGSIKDKLDWLDKAEQSGVLKQGNPDIEIGKPLSPSNKQVTDTSKLSASSMLSMAYGNAKSKK